MREAERKDGSGSAKRSAGGRRLLGAVLVLVFGISAGILYHHLVALPEQNREMTEQLKEDFPGEKLPEEPSPAGEPAGEKSLPLLVDLAALMEQYPDVRGWISIPDTGIDYPVLQSSADDPQYYLRRNYKGEYDINGSIFLQWDCDVREGQNLVIYGHNMKSGVMFGTLDEYADLPYCKEHPAVLFQTEGGVYSYTVVAVLKADVSMFPFRQTVFQEPDGLSLYLSQAKALQLFENGQTIAADPKQVLTLVTCSYEWDGARNIVIAVRE
ncbi:class B sortase [Faecalimonas umbilicata]|nr:class B sortase [Faecalimonas umbilicata]